MTCSSSDLFERTWPRGSVDYIDAQITLRDGLGAALTIKNDEPVAFTFDRETYYDGEWIGTAGSPRTCQVLIDDSKLPTTHDVVDVFVRVTDNPTIQIILVGTLNLI
jgi:hypothetical protein